MLSHSATTIRHLRRRFSWAASVLALLTPLRAHAQNDLDPPLPNVLLLVDSSGSMEYKTDGSAFPKCYPDGSQTSERSRWIDLVEVLSGSIQNYRCQAVNRSSSSFLAEYDANGSTAGRPYDYLYANPYHRPMSGECVAVPGLLSPSSPYAFPQDDPGTVGVYEGAIRFREYDAATGTCTFNQTQDGILDAFERQVRFGLMTFDPLPGAQTGVAGNTLNYDAGMLGGWSYVWGNARKANPAGCTEAPTDFDVGARNAAAPPWEGRMVAFGDPASGTTEYLTKNSEIQQVLLATRPYGATPIAGLLHDARDFFHNDTSTDPLNPSRSFGPKTDPYVSGGAAGCRDQSILLLTDGQPNLDMRPHCEGTLGVCPFDKPETIAADLVSGSRPIDTLVIPFAMPTFQLGAQQYNCNDLGEDDFDETNPAGPCGNPANRDNAALQACCALNRIAVSGSRPERAELYPGGKPRAFFAANKQELASVISNVLTALMRVTSRTQPVIAGPSAGVSGMRFFSLVRPVSFQPWVGLLRRQRYSCDADSFVPEPLAIDLNKGDDLGANLAAQPQLRTFATIRAGSGNQAVLSQNTIRPFYQPSGNSDGAGVYGGSRTVGSRDQFVTQVTSEAMALSANACGNGMSADQCRTLYLRWLVGLPNPGVTFSRCPNATECYLLGDVLHSTPRVVAPPSELLRDETYTAFSARHRERPIVLYTSSNDGMLHAFRVGTRKTGNVTDSEKALTRANHELWAFLPPAVLPELGSIYPFRHQQLLDGAPIVKDVVATGDPDDTDGILLERTRAGAKTAGETDIWRTILVQSFGPKRSGYFALDVTEPEIDAQNPNDPDRGPRFLWQLTKDATTAPIFGRSGPTPAIATLYFDPDGGTGTNPREIAVALLSGGDGGSGSSGSGAGCPGAVARSYSNLTFSHSVQPRGRVRCYSSSLGGRSLTVVRLDTGEIIRTFRQDPSEIVDADLRQRVTQVNLDSPITGQPVAFPSETGAVADRAYVGDQDGRLWRADFSSTDPADWTMELFFDGFPTSVAGSTLHDFDDGQPITLPPVISVDQNGDVTIAFATGDQETLGSAAGVTNYVWSLTEKLSANRESVERQLNWYLPLTNGERVVGPLQLFNSQLFFSTYTPPAAGAAACDQGSSRVWGLDYLRPLVEGAANPNQGGAPRLPDPDDEAALVRVLTAAEATNDADAVIFGVSVAQQPTCSGIETGTADEFLGYGEETRVTNVNPGAFELVMHKGGVAGADPGGDISANVATLPLRPPPSASRIDSWAALIE